MSEMIEFSFPGEAQFLDFGKPFDQMSIEEVENVVKWYYEHIGNRAYNDAFAAAVAPYLERRKHGLTATWIHPVEMGGYARRGKEAYDRLIAARDARIAADKARAAARAA